MPVGAACGHEWLQSPASALGKGAHADRKKNPAQGFPRGCAPSRQIRSVLPSHREYFLSLDGSSVYHAASGDDRSLLPGLVPDAGDRSAPIPRFHLLHFQFLSRRAKGIAPEDLAKYVPLLALRDGHGHWFERA